MSRQFKLVGGAIAAVIIIAVCLVAVRSLLPGGSVTPEGYKLLTAMPSRDGFEPKVLPPSPVLSNQSSSDLTVNFGYKVGGVPYSYAMAVSFPADGNDGRAVVTVRHGGREASVETSTVRRWDEPRQAYAIALQEKFMIEPAVPSLCIKAVIGPKTNGYDLKDASLCIAQRDAAGTCHSETLACGLIR